MTLTRTAPPAVEDGVEGNARLTGSTAAVLFVLLFVEGVTILRLRELLAVHFFVGLLLVPPVLLKIGSTGWRFMRFYSRAPGYVRRGAPPLLLRGSGPLVVLTTVAVLGTGVGLLFVAPAHARWLVGLHKLSFVAWFLLMAVHVLAHLRDTVVLAGRDWRSARRPARVRRVAIAASLAAGVALGALSLPAASTWTHWLGTHRFEQG